MPDADWTETGGAVGASRTRRGLSEIRTALKQRLVSRSRPGGSEYLSLYILSRERNRLTQEMAAVCKRKSLVQQALEQVDERMGQRLADMSMPPSALRSAPPQPPPDVLPKIQSIPFPY